jgi:hypothetical protein
MYVSCVNVFLSILLCPGVDILNYMSLLCSNMRVSGDLLKYRAYLMYFLFSGFMFVLDGHLKCVKLKFHNILRFCLY